MIDYLKFYVNYNLGIRKRKRNKKTKYDTYAGIPLAHDGDVMFSETNSLCPVPQIRV